MKKAIGGTAATTFICIVLGMIIGIQIKTIKKVETVDMQRSTELSAEISRLKEENLNLNKKISEQNIKIKEYESSLAAEDETFAMLVEEAEGYKIKAGFMEMTGRGITVTLDDSKKSEQISGTSSGAFLVHDEDLLSVVNELYASGAEACSINDQRLVSGSAIRCVGPVVSINGVRVSAPFVVTAIGNPDVLEAALRITGGVVDSLSPWGIEVTIKKHESLTVPAYEQAIYYQEARPVFSEEEGNE